MSNTQTKSLLYKRTYLTSNPLPEFSAEDIASILEQLQFIAGYLDYEEASHRVLFHNIYEGSRRDITIHYANKFPIIESNESPDNLVYKYQDRVLKVNIVWLFTKEKDDKAELRIYQIGRRYASNEFTVNDLYGLGELNYEIEQYDKAIDYYTQALEREPTDADILNNLGLAYVGTQQYSKAIECYHQAIQSDPEDSLIWDNLGLAYEGINEIEKAKECYEKALSLDFLDEDAQYHLRELKERKL